MNFLQVQREIPDLNPTFVLEIFGIQIASSTAMIMLLTVLFAVASFFIVRNFKEMPGRFQSAIELVYEQILELIEQIANSKHHAKILFPIIGSLLVYLIAANLIALVPGITSITVDGNPLLQSPTADFNTTIGLAFGAIIIIQIISIRSNGILGYLGNFFKFKEVFLGFRKGIGSGFIALIDFFVGLLDIIGELAKMVSLALRLFGNMYAGNILMVILFGAIAYGVPAIWLGMNIFVGILQAMVFASLVAAYYMLAVKTESSEKNNK